MKVFLSYQPLGMWSTVRPLGQKLNEVGLSDDKQREDATHAADNVFVAPMSGRFYTKASPDDEPFVKVGDAVSEGQVVCLLEVMKTFNRVVFRGDAGVIQRIVPEDGADVSRGEPLLELK